MKIGLDFRHGPGLGDLIISTAIPENYYRNIGEKLIDPFNHFLFDFNPFIERNEKPDVFYKNQQLQDDASSLCYTKFGIKQLLSISWKLNHVFGLKETFLNHPRLYKYEDSETILNKICVHTTAKTLGGTMDDNVIQTIKNNYKQYEIFQVGGKTDKEFPGAVDLRGLEFWDTAKHISESAIFIGVDSSQLHIATCYPKVRKKVINYYLTKEAFLKYTPLNTDASWWEFNMETYCPFDRDYGVAMSYLKI